MCSRAGQGNADLSAFQLEGCQVLEYVRHKRKLRLGALKVTPLPWFCAK